MIKIYNHIFCRIRSESSRSFSHLHVETISITLVEALFVFLSSYNLVLIQFLHLLPMLLPLHHLRRKPGIHRLPHLVLVPPELSCLTEGSLIVLNNMGVDVEGISDFLNVELRFAFEN